MPEDTPIPAFPVTQENTPEGLRGVLDYRLAEWSEGRAVVEMRVDGRHLNRSGVLHGGVIATLLDASCGYAATWSGDPAKPKAAVTLSLTVSYTGQVKEGVVRATALMKAGGRKIVFCTGEVRDGAGNLIGMGEGSFRFRSGSERDSPVASA